MPHTHSDWLDWDGNSDDESHSSSAADSEDALHDETVPQQVKETMPEVGNANEESIEALDASKSPNAPHISTQIFEISDHTTRTPFEQLCASLHSQIQQYLAPFIANEASSPKSQHALFDITYHDTPFQLIYHNASVTSSMTHFTASRRHHIPYYFSIDEPYLLMHAKSRVASSDSSSAKSRIERSLVRDIMSAWQCIVMHQLMLGQREQQEVPAEAAAQELPQDNAWIHMPFFCPSGSNLEYHGIKFISHSQIHHFRSELFDQGSEQWSIRERQAMQVKGSKTAPTPVPEGKSASQLQEKYRHIASWLQLFPYYCRAPRDTSLKHFIITHPLEYNVQLTYEIENDLLHWGDSLGDEKARLDSRLFEAEVEEQDDDIEQDASSPSSTAAVKDASPRDEDRSTSRQHTYAPLPILNFGTLNHPLDIVFCAAQWINKSLAESKVADHLDNSAALLENEHELFQLQDVNGWEIKIQIRPDSECELSNNLHWFKDMIFAAMSDIARESEHNKLMAAQRDEPATSMSNSPNPEKTMEMMQTAFQTITPYLSTERSLSENEMRTIQSNLLVNKVFGVKLNPRGGRIHFVNHSSGRKYLPKTFPLNSILASLSVQAAQLEEYSQIKYLWKMFLMALRECWEKQQLIPNVFGSAPNWDYSILHQKLVLLNCCIKKAQEEEAKQDLLQKDSHNNDETSSSSASVEQAATHAPLSPTSDSDDEFVDANSLHSDAESKQSTEDEELDDTTRLAAYEESRQGASHPLDPPTNLKHIEAPIMVPITQETPPITEDKFQEQQNLFAKLGTTKEASQLRQSMQAESLKSDMAAFKAANPGSCFEDFLKWYSPRDIEDGEELSTRMTHRNMWQEMWTSAESKPAFEQKSLFNFEREAEMVLHDLETFPLDRLMREMLIFLVVSGFVALRSVVEDVLPHVPYLSERMQELQQHITQIASNMSVVPERYEALAQHFERMELLISTVIAVRHQVLCPTVRVVPEILRPMFFQMLNDLCEKHVFVFQSTEQGVIEEANLFFSERFDLTSGQEATHREYVLRSKDDLSTNQLRIAIHQKSLRISSIHSSGGH